MGSSARSPGWLLRRCQISLVLRSLSRSNLSKHREGACCIRPLAAALPPRCCRLLASGSMRTIPISGVMSFEGDTTVLLRPSQQCMAQDARRRQLFISKGASAYLAFRLFITRQVRFRLAPVCRAELRHRLVHADRLQLPALVSFHTFRGVLQ